MANLRVAHELRRLRKQRAAARQHRVANDCRVAGERSDRDPVAVLAHVPEVVEPADVDHHARACDTELQRRDQGLPSGEQLRILVTAEELDRLVDRAGSRVRERSRDHAPALAAASTARTMLG